MSLGEFPEPTIGDHVHAGAVVGLNFVPGIGGGLAALLEKTIRPPLQRRFERYLRVTGDAVEYLLEHGLTTEQLENDDGFITAVVRGSEIARGQYIDEKLEMLKACLINQALPHVLSDLISRRFLEFVEELEVQHISVLRYASNPEQWYSDRGLEHTMPSGTRQGAMEAAGLELHPIEREFAVQELNSRRLVAAQMLGGIVTGPEAYTPWITDLGRQFLAWITIV